MASSREFVVIKGKYDSLAGIQKRMLMQSELIHRFTAVFEPECEKSTWLSHAWGPVHDDMHVDWYEVNGESGVYSTRWGWFVGLIDGYAFTFELDDEHTAATSDSPYRPAGLPTDTELRSRYGIATLDVVLGEDLLQPYLDAVIVGRRIPGMDCSPVFGLPERKADSTLAFVLMPFSEDWSSRIWKRHLQPAIMAAGFTPQRADDIYSPNVLISDIWNAIAAAAIIVADVTNNNPNVMYELGIAHTLGKPVIIICQENSKRPFDTSHWRHLLYNDNSEGCEQLELNLKKTLDAVKGKLTLT